MTDENKQLSKVERWMENQVDHLSKVGKSAYPGLIIGAAVFAFFMQPLIKFIDSAHALPAALALSGGLILATTAILLNRDFLGILFGIAGMFLGTGLLLNEVDNASKLANINDQRCMIIEKDMVSSKPSRNDLPDLFTAFGCRPQTNLLVQSLSK